MSPDGDSDVRARVKELVDALSAAFAIPLPIFLVVSVAFWIGGPEVTILGVTVPKTVALLLTQVVIGANFLNCTRYEAALAAMVAGTGGSRDVILDAICQNISIMNPFYQSQVDPLPPSMPRWLGSIYIPFVFFSQAVGIGALHGFACAFPMFGTLMADVPLATRLVLILAMGFSQIAVIFSFVSVGRIYGMLGHGWTMGLFCIGMVAGGGLAFALVAIVQLTSI